VAGLVLQLLQALRGVMQACFGLYGLVSFGLALA